MLNKKNKMLMTLLLIVALCAALCGCASSGGGDNTVNIYSANYEEEIAIELAYLQEIFPEYNITITYLSSGNLAAKIAAEGEDTDIDIAMSLSSGYANQLKDAGALLAFDTGVEYKDEFVDEDNMVIPNGVWAGAIVVNTSLLEQLGLEAPTSYMDLLDEAYAGHIVMANPASSSTGYFFLQGILNLYGEDGGWAFFDSLHESVMMFTESGSAPVTMVESGEAAIALGIDYQAIALASESSPIEVIFADEGAPYDYDTALLINRGGTPSEAVLNVMAAITSEEGNDVFNNYNISVLKDGPEAVGYPDSFYLMDMTGISDSALKTEILNAWSARYE
ncbi:MAG: extracellular solute-binding protein [Oscillospiraceae bacterium]|nr:extracellular solute-binding protein [Oscillospiraceae bacterium]